MTDPIADMLTRIRNAELVHKSDVVLPYSKLKYNILILLAKEGWIAAVDKLDPDQDKAVVKKKLENENRFTTLKITLKYLPDRRPKISSLTRISKPGRRVYASKDRLPFVLSGRGIAVISTPQGVLSDRQARQAGVGGEVICEIY